jgi:DNA-binding MarR family transcriptional regulator
MSKPQKNILASTLVHRQTQSILDSIRRIVRALRTSSRFAEKNLGISGAQLFVLQKLGDGASLSINELAQRTLTHQSSVSVVVRRLLKKGLISRTISQHDARRLKLSLSKKGKDFLKRSPSTVQERLVLAIEKLPDKKRAHLSGLLGLIVSEAGLDHNDPQLFFEDEKE